MMSPPDDVTEPDWEELGLIGSCESMYAVKELIQKYARSNWPVIITGPAGSGKEIVARACHTLSQRQNCPFVPVQISALSQTLVESELFGHAKEAFTGAHRAKIGRLEEVRDGTLFLDEIGTLSVEVQVTLLRVLQEKVFQRVGESQARDLDARIIAATNEDLGCAIADGRIRKDFYDRLSVLPIELPPLASRGDDIRLLTAFFLKKFAREDGKPLRSVAEEVWTKLGTHDWPGNVRELQSVIARAVVLAGSRATDLTIDLIRFDEVLQGIALGSVGSDGTATATEMIEEMVVDDLLRGAAPLDGLKRGASDLSPLVEGLVGGVAEGLRRYLDTPPGVRLLRNQGRRAVLMRLGLGRRPGNESEFFSRVRAAAGQVLDSADER